MSIVEKYMDGLKKAYYEYGGKEQWDEFEKAVHGASEEDLAELQSLYPDMPESLIQLLKIVDGTYWREYAGKSLLFIFLVLMWKSILIICFPQNRCARRGSLTG